MTQATTADPLIPAFSPEIAGAGVNLLNRVRASGRIVIGGVILIVILLLCLVSLPRTLAPGDSLYYDQQDSTIARAAPAAHPMARWFGSDFLGRSLLGRTLLGGAISLAIGAAAASISVVV